MSQNVCGLRCSSPRLSVSSRLTWAAMFVFASTLVIATASWASSTAPSEWTVMVYMNAKNNLECDALDNFAQMATVGSRSKTNVVVELGRPQMVVENGQPHSKYQCGDSDPWDGVLRFYVTKDQAPSPKTALANLGKVDMGSGKTLADFVDWAMTKYTARHYLLVIWNHGQGWRFQAARNEALKLGSAKGRGQSTHAATAQATAPNAETRTVGGFRSVSFDDDTGNFLYNSDIQTGLGAVLAPKGRVLDVIGFDACLMAMIETGYAMRSVSNVMVASEELVPGAGWDYGDFLTKLESNSAHIDGKQLGSILVNSYKQAYRDRLKTTLSAVDLTQTAALATALDSLAKALETGSQTDRTIIASARGSCANYGQDAGFTNPVDVSEFANNLLSLSKNSAIIDAAKRVNGVVGSQFVYSRYASARSQGHFGSYGVSIYFPRTKADFDTDPDKDGYVRTNSDHTVEFVKSREWSVFLNQYLNLSNQGSTATSVHP
jgi:Clostripain family